MRERIINLEAKKKRLAEMAKSKDDELAPAWLKTILMQMLDKETKMHIGEELAKDEVNYEVAKARVTDFITLNEDDGKSGLNSMGPGAHKEKEFDWNKPIEEWETDQVKASLDALKGGGKQGGGKGGNCWNCGKPGDRSFEC